MSAPEKLVGGINVLDVWGRMKFHEVSSDYAALIRPTLVGSSVEAIR